MATTFTANSGNRYIDSIIKSAPDTTVVDNAARQREEDLKNIKNENAELRNFTGTYMQDNPFSFNENDPYINAARRIQQNTAGGTAQDIARQLAASGNTNTGAAQNALVGLNQANQTQMLGVIGQQYNTQMNRYIDQMKDIYSQRLNSMNFENALSQQQYTDAIDRYYQQLSVETEQAALQYQREQQRKQNNQSVLGGLLGGLGGLAGTLIGGPAGTAVGSSLGAGLGNLFGSLS